MIAAARKLVRGGTRLAEDHGAASRLASGLLSHPWPLPLPPASRAIQRKVPSRGGIQVARHVHVGLPHAGRIVTIELGDTTPRVIGGNGELLTTVPRTSTGEISRFKAYGTRHSH